MMMTAAPVPPEPAAPAPAPAPAPLAPVAPAFGATRNSCTSVPALAGDPASGICVLTRSVGLGGDGLVGPSASPALVTILSASTNDLPTTFGTFLVLTPTVITSETTLPFL